MSKLIRFALTIIVVHLAVSTLHGTAHKILGVHLSVLQSLFVIIVIAIAPLLAGVLLWKRKSAAGAVVLLLSMVGALVFGVYNHFVEISSDHVSQVSALSHGVWVPIFQVTAFLLAPVEALGALAAMLLLKSGER